MDPVGGRSPPQGTARDTNQWSNRLIEWTLDLSRHPKDTSREFSCSQILLTKSTLYRSYVQKTGSVPVLLAFAGVAGVDALTRTIGVNIAKGEVPFLC